MSITSVAMAVNPLKNFPTLGWLQSNFSSSSHSHTVSIYSRSQKIRAPWGQFLNCGLVMTYGNVLLTSSSAPFISSPFCPINHTVSQSVSQTDRQSLLLYTFFIHGSVNNAFC